MCGVHENDAAEEIEASAGDPGATDQCAAEEDDVICVPRDCPTVLRVVTGVDDGFAYVDGE